MFRGGYMLFANMEPEIKVHSGGKYIFFKYRNQIPGIPSRNILLVSKFINKQRSIENGCVLSVSKL